MRTLLALLALLPQPSPARSPDARPLSRRFYVTAAEIRTEDPRALAAALVARLRTGCDEAGAAVGPSPLGGKYRLIVMVPAAALDSIARDGLRNQHETATTGGFLEPFARFEAEQELAMLRLPYGARGRALLPKYALVRAAALGRELAPTRYGAVALVLKPEAAERATWTYADSMDFSRRAGLYELEGESNSVLTRTFAYRRRRGDGNSCVNYCEAQLWGPVTLDDVAYAIVPAGVPIPDDFSRRVEVRRGPRATAPRRAVSSAGLRRGLAMAKLDDAALIAAVAASTGPDRARLIGELSERAPSPAVLAALSGLAGSAIAFERELALYGLAQGSWTEFKPFLLAGLRDPSSEVALEAVALSDERRADPDVARALAQLRASLGRREESGGRQLAEWLDRLDAPSLCPDRRR